MELYIIRHGETEWNTLNQLQGQTDIPLNENGIQMAKLVGQKISQIDFDVIWSSPLQRAVKTARLVTGEKNIPLKTDSRLMEISFGEWEGLRITDSDAVPPEFNRLFHDDPLHCPKAPGGESFQDVLNRTGAFCEELCQNTEYQNARILISTHGAAGRCLLTYFHQEITDLWQGGVPKNCSVCIVQITNGVGKILEMDKLFL